MSDLDAGLPSLPSVQARRGVFWSSVLVSVWVGLYGGWNAWQVNQHRTLGMDLDGWGALVQRLKSPDAGFATLFSSPSLWKGPVVPFIYGLCYYIAPWDESVLVFNVLAAVLAAGCFVYAYCSMGIHRLTAMLAVLFGFSYWPHHMIFGYYFAECVLTLLLALLLLLSYWTVTTNRSLTALTLGCTAGLLLLARAPFVLVVCGLGFLIWRHATDRTKRMKIATWYAGGILIVFAPWAIRNYLVYQEFIPFTIEGGKILFQGTYLAGDSATLTEVRQLSEYAELERKEGTDPIDQYRYWRSLAGRQIRENPVGQLRLCVRKAMRFWVYLPQYSWTPTWKTSLVALISLPLAFVGWVVGRRSFLIQFCALSVCGLWVFHALVHAELRYNYPVLPLFFLLTIVGFCHLCGFRFLSKPNTSASEVTKSALRKEVCFSPEGAKLTGDA